MTSLKHTHTQPHAPEESALPTADTKIDWHALLTH